MANPQPHAAPGKSVAAPRETQDVPKEGPLVRLKDVRKHFGRQEVLRGVDLEILSGERMVILGRSGSGKSVLLKHMMGLVQPDAGHVYFAGQDLATMTEAEITPLRRRMGMLFQSGALFDSMSVFENVAFPMREEGKASEKEIADAVENALAVVDLGGQEKKMPANLSGGMRKRVALARATISRPELMLYDEPTAGLDPIVAASIDKLIVRLSQELSITSVIVTHDMKSALRIADRLAMLHKGKIYRVGTSDEFRADTDPVIHNFVNGISEEVGLEIESH